MFVACSTLCFAREPLETALRQIAELEFDKFELALVEDGQHLRPSEVGDNPEAALQRLRSGPSLIPSSLYIDFGGVDWTDPLTRKRFDGLCRLAKSLSVAVITLHASPTGTPVADEVKRLAPLAGILAVEPWPEVGRPPLLRAEGRCLAESCLLRMRYSPCPSLARSRRILIR